jgi:hypothetical protein
VRNNFSGAGGDIVAKVIRRAGDTPFKVRTTSGKTHLVSASMASDDLRGDQAIAQPWNDVCVDIGKLQWDGCAAVARIATRVKILSPRNKAIAKCGFIADREGS